MPREYNIPDWLNEAYLKKMDEVLELFQEPFVFDATDDDILQALDESTSYGEVWLGHPPRVRNPEEKIIWSGEGANIGFMALVESDAWILRHLLPEAIRQCSIIYERGESMAEGDVPLLLVQSLTPSQHLQFSHELSDLAALMSEREIHLVISFLELMTLKPKCEEATLAKVALDTFWYKLSPKGAPSEDE